VMRCCLIRAILHLKRKFSNTAPKLLIVEGWDLLWLCFQSYHGIVNFRLFTNELTQEDESDIMSWMNHVNINILERIPEKKSPGNQGNDSTIIYVL
jgi:hypothetical protein